MYGWSVNIAAKPRLTNDALEHNLLPTQQRDGVAARTRIVTEHGWRPVETIVAGDRVQTFDNGLKSVLAVKRAVLWVDHLYATSPVWPVTIPAHAFGNGRDVILMPEQRLMLESERFSDALGDPYAVAPAEALLGVCGTYRDMPLKPIDLTTLFFADEEVVCADGGLLIHCPRKIDALSERAQPVETLYPQISLNEAREVLQNCETARVPVAQDFEAESGETMSHLVA
ncbi:Hint domain-containing protein [Roseobacter sp.]|uniref:Hint domain-containing protein n=1 Tax=Roseobacter sp. TaxID=1907202 RepID=UPI00385D1AC8